MDAATIALILGSSLLPSLFGESQAKKRERMIQEYLDMIKPEFQYWSGQARGINPMILEALKTQMARYQGFGWPSEGGG